MTCREFADFIMDSLTGELPSALRAEFDHHLGLCSNCRKYLADYQESVKLAQGAFDDDSALPDDVPEELIKNILAVRRRAVKPLAGII